MKGTIRYIADVAESRYERADFGEFVAWISSQTAYQLDIETTVAENWNEYKLISIQFGSCEFSSHGRRQYFFQWSALSLHEQDTIKKILTWNWQQKLAHNAKFEYIVLRFTLGVIIENLYDTMLAEKVLRGGMENVDYALADISWRYLRIIMNKTEQTNFGDDIINDSKILYGCTDVMYLDIIKRQQIQEAAQQNLLNVFALEMEALPAFSDITYEGMILDKDAWRANIRLAEPIVQAAKTQLDTWLLKPLFHAFAIQQGYISDEDRITINFNSVQQRTELLKLLFPDISGGTQAIVKKYMRDRSVRDDQKGIVPMELADINLLMDYMEKNYSRMEGRLLDKHRKYLIDKGYLIPAGEPTINWNSQAQVLPLFQVAMPKLRSLAEEETAKFVHEIISDRSEYVDALKLISTYGEEFIRKHVNSDGKVRTNFNQVVSTGRVSSSRPNMQNIPAKESVGTRYRNAFVCEPGWAMIDSDYTGQELALIAHASKDPVWLGAIERGEDLHSVCAELVYRLKWKDASDKDCDYYKMSVTEDGTLNMSKQKCSCKGHKKLRNSVKTINFGLAYGMSEIKLAATLKISRSEALDLINEYFRTFPKIEATLKFLGHFGVKQGYIQTFAPFFRKRWFPFWNENRPFIETHVSGIKYNPTLGEIERASKNMPFQGGGGDMVKLALILVRNYIRTHNLWDTVKLQMQVHDQITTKARVEFAAEWKKIFDDLMCQAAQVIIPTGILKADTNVTPVWTK